MARNRRPRNRDELRTLESHARSRPTTKYGCDVAARAVEMLWTDSDVKMWVILSDIASDPSVSEHTLFRSIIDFRRYCARRLRRLRKKLGLSKAKGRNSLSEELLPTAEHVIIPFMLAERAWARAMELKGNPLEGAYKNSRTGDGGCSIRTDHHHHLAVSTINNETGESTAAILNWCGQSLRVTEKVQQRLLTCGMEQQPDAKGVALNETQYARKLQQLEDLSRSLCDVELVSPAVPKGDRIVENNKPLELMTARISYEKLDLLYQRCDSAVADRASAWRRNALEAAESLVLGGISDSKLARMPDDVLYLYENLIQVTTGMSSLAGVRDGHDEVLAEVLDARAAALRAYKCHYLAETFSVRASLAPNAFALFHHASHLADCALLEAEACEVPQMGQEMAHLSDASRASTSRLKAARVMKSNHNGDCQIRGPSFASHSCSTLPITN
ncbi:hypothetical protein AURANDRAFT_67772 [Aureococcus anophagefferens]|uniref:Signal recognition particle subunit SRP68 n=1 Tax=Aureococcus anophagefferens TaxID=44056 RepID=F0YMC3_AURAN|nr:hypothetical protein AURANDRAFT_67772 [Aureococcus anophagefferens]EGB03739.1 hypothetical protein AURANDRAFT_67772 [Aureococcus anophagefferens]|eukprot:XP_009041593.1 hypothetical protein AURANDRAFT_67772 [Aureococcus anophagefferens]